MKVVILCGGQGTRLKEETEFKPKPLVEVGGVPIVWHIMKHFSTYGHNEFVLCLGYKGRMIKEFFMEYDWDMYDCTLNLKDGSVTSHHDNKEDWTITFADTGEKTLTAGRVQAVEKYIPQDDDVFILTYGDGVSDVDIDKLLAFHKEKGKMVTVTGVHPASKYGLMKMTDHLEVLDFAEKPPMTDYINGGFIVMNKDVFKHITEDCMLESVVLPKLAKEGHVALFPHEGFWHCMDTYKDYQDLNEMWRNGAPWKTWNDHPR